VSAIVFVIGVVLCFFGSKTAETTGEQIFAMKSGDDRVYTYEFTKADKIKIDVTNADINVICGKGRASYVEIVNFNENLSNYTANNAIITFKETVKVEDIAGLWESGVSFKGLRYILRPVPADKQKTVNIYLAEGVEIKAFDIQLQKGIVSVEGVKTLTDYHVNIESGKVLFTDVTTESGIDIVTKGDISTDVKFTRVSCDFLTLNARRAKFFGESFTSNLCELAVSAGSAAFEYIPKNPEYTVEIDSKGKLEVDGVLYIDKFSYPPKEEEPAPEEPEKPEDETEEEAPEPSALKILGEDFSVSLTTPAGIVPEEPADTTQDTTAVQ